MLEVSNRQYIRQKFGLQNYDNVKIYCLRFLHKILELKGEGDDKRMGVFQPISIDRELIIFSKWLYRDIIDTALKLKSITNL